MLLRTWNLTTTIMPGYTNFVWTSATPGTSLCLTYHTSDTVSSVLYAFSFNPHNNLSILIFRDNKIESYRGYTACPRRLASGLAERNTQESLLSIYTAQCRTMILLPHSVWQTQSSSFNRSLTLTSKMSIEV